MGQDERSGEVRDLKKVQKFGKYILRKIEEITDQKKAEKSQGTVDCLVRVCDYELIIGLFQ